jgi:hypothetical protein
MARWSDRGRSNLIYTGSIKLDRLIRHLPADSTRDKGYGLDDQPGSMAAIYTCLTSPIEGLAKQGRLSMCKNKKGLSICARKAYLTRRSSQTFGANEIMLRELCGAFTFLHSLDPEQPLGVS